MRGIKDVTSVAGGGALLAAAAVFAYTAFDAFTVDPVEGGTSLTLEVAELPPGVEGGSDWVRPVSRDAGAAPDRGFRTRQARGKLEPGTDITQGDLARLRDAERAVSEDGGVAPEEQLPTFRGAATSTDELLALAVSNDPFRPERRPGPAYVMPWERRASAPVRNRDEEEDDEPEWPEFRVVGFAATPAGGAALVQYDEDTPVLLIVGERIRGYELIAVDTVDGGGATLTGPAGQIRFPVREPRVDNDDRRRRRRGDDDDNDRRGNNGRQSQLQQVQDIMRRLQGRGGRGGVSLDIRLPGTVINRGGGALQEFSLGGTPEPRWSPDGHYVVFNAGSGN